MYCGREIGGPTSASRPPPGYEPTPASSSARKRTPAPPAAASRPATTSPRRSGARNVVYTRHLGQHGTEEPSTTRASPLLPPLPGQRRHDGARRSEPVGAIFMHACRRAPRRGGHRRGDRLAGLRRLPAGAQPAACPGKRSCCCCGALRAAQALEHRVSFAAVDRNGLQHVPVFENLALAVEAENIHNPHALPRPVQVSAHG